MTEASEKPAGPATDKVGVVIVAAGRGARAGQADGPKQYQRIGGRAVIARTLETFLAHPAIGPVVVAIHADDRADLAVVAQSPIFTCVCHCAWW